MTSRVTFFVIKPDLSAFGVPSMLHWAKAYWDTYGFDYDISRSRGDAVFAWALNVSADELKQALDQAEIPYETFDSNVQHLFQ